MLICAHNLRTSCGGWYEGAEGAPQLSVPPGAFGGTGPGMRGMRGKRGKRGAHGARGARGIVAQVEGVIGFFAQYLPVFYIGSP